LLKVAPTCVHLKCTARTVFPQHHSAVAVSAATVTISGESQTTRYTASYCPLRSTAAAATVTAFQKVLNICLLLLHAGPPSVAMAQTAGSKLASGTEI
jgi:hypothetical protein